MNQPFSSRQNGRTQYPRPAQPQRAPMPASASSRGNQSGMRAGERPNISNFNMPTRGQPQRAAPPSVPSYPPPQRGMSNTQALNNLKARYNNSIPTRQATVSYKDLIQPYIPQAVRAQQAAEMQQQYEAEQQYEPPQVNYPQQPSRQQRPAVDLSRFQRPYVKQTPALQRPQHEDEAQLEDVSNIPEETF